MIDSISRSFVTPKELAEALGLGESSVKRWADEGRIQVGRTHGGHRRIPIAQAVRFVRESGLPLVNPGRLGLPALRSQAEALDSGAPPANAFRVALLEGRADEADRLLLGEFFSGKSVAAVADDLLAPAMDAIGELWKADTDGIFIEHRAHEICAQCVRHMVAYLPRPAGAAPIALGAGPSRDVHSLSTLLVAGVLMEKGFNAINLGAETPMEVFDVALRAYQPRVLWISMTLDIEIGQNSDLVQGIRRLAKKVHAWEGDVVLGGRAVPTALQTSRVENLHYFQSMRDLEVYAEERITSAAV